MAKRGDPNLQHLQTYYKRSGPTLTIPPSLSSSTSQYLYTHSLLHAQYMHPLLSQTTKRGNPSLHPLTNVLEEIRPQFHPFFLPFFLIHSVLFHCFTPSIRSRFLSSLKNCRERSSPTLATLSPSPSQYFYTLTSSLSTRILSSLTDCKAWYPEPISRNKHPRTIPSSLSPSPSQYPHFLLLLQPVPSHTSSLLPTDSRAR